MAVQAAINHPRKRHKSRFSPLVPKFPLAGGAMGPLRAAAEASGSLDFTPLWVGEGAAPRAEPAASIVAALVGQE